MMNSRYITAMPVRERNFITLGLNRPLRKFKLPILLTLAHIPLGVLLYNVGALGLVHPLIVFFLGLQRAFRRQVQLEKVWLIVAYLVSVEILWRMARVPVFWEFGKYGAAAIMILALARRGCWKIPTLPLLYFLFLLPACFLTLTKFDLNMSKNFLSFAMSGPLLLFVSCWFCSYLKVDWTQFKSVFFTIIIPISSVAVTTLFYTVTAEDIQFNTESNLATSGAFGPNQVSAILGLGAFVCFAGYLIFRNSLTDKLYLGVFAVLFVAQSVMTFSRGGIYNAAGAILAMILVQIRNPLQGIRRLLPIIAVIVIFFLLIFPLLNDFTGGELQERFKETDTTNRGSVVEADIQIFTENPIFGVGVGASFFEYPRIMARLIGSHTEFSRLLSEHGIFGILALVCLVFIILSNFRRQKTNVGKALVAGLFVWSCIFMLSAGMRLAAPSFILGMCFLTLSQGQPSRLFNSPR